MSQAYIGMQNSQWPKDRLSNNVTPMMAFVSSISQAKNLLAFEVGSVALFEKLKL